MPCEDGVSCVCVCVCVFVCVCMMLGYEAVPSEVGVVERERKRERVCV